jgi:hypothetical protein
MYKSVLKCCRNLLPDDAFEDRDWSDVPEGTHWAYSDFLAGSKPFLGTSQRKGKAKQVGRPVKILTQSGSKGAMKVMSWLVGLASFFDALASLLNCTQNGIFDALKKGLLARLAFSVILDPTRPNDVIEAYNFRFEYTDINGDVTTHSNNMRSVAQTEPPITVTDARHGVAALIRYLLELTENLPALPSQYSPVVASKYH